MAPQKQTEQQPPSEQQPSQPPEQQHDDGKIAEAVEKAVRDAFAKALAGKQDDAGGGGQQHSAPPSSAPPTDQGSIADAIDAAVSRALAERDKQDALAVLADEIDQLKAKITQAPASRKRGWGSYLLGPGLLR